MILQNHPKNGDKLPNGCIIDEIVKYSVGTPSGRITIYELNLTTGNGIERCASYDARKKEVGFFSKVDSSFGQGSYYKTWTRTMNKPIKFKQS